jgi:hypothetical protein
MELVIRRRKIRYEFGTLNYAVFGFEKKKKKSTRKETSYTRV